MTDLPQEGQKLPDLRFIAEDGSELAVRNLEGRKTVLYFYPKDGTPGCTNEACAFRDRIEDYRNRGIEVYGVSLDSPESHREFRKENGLNFPLLTDEEGEAAAALGILGDRGVASRTTFLLGVDGEVEKVYPEVSPETHADEILSDAGRS